MNKQTIKIVVSLVAFAIMAGYQYFTTGKMPDLPKHSPSKTEQNSSKKDTKPADKFTKDEQILASMQSKKLIYTKHARCRMECRTISEPEVVAILKKGKINHQKSEQASGNQCPTYAVEGATNDGQEVRIVFAGCNDVTKVVTTIDLGKDYNCYCE